MPREAETEILDLADRFPRKRKDGVLLRVGRNHLAVVAAEMRFGEIARQRNADGEVLDLVLCSRPRHADDVRLRLAVLVVAEDDGHVPL